MEIHNKDPVFDEMSIMHFTNYVALGLFIKNKYFFAFLIGIIWEIFEYNVTNNKYLENLLVEYWPIPKRLWEEKNIFNRIVDLICNMLGYYVGSSLHLKFHQFFNKCFS